MSQIASTFSSLTSISANMLLCRQRTSPLCAAFLVAAGPHSTHTSSTIESCESLCDEDVADRAPVVHDHSSLLLNDGHRCKCHLLIKLHMSQLRLPPRVRARAHCSVYATRPSSRNQRKGRPRRDIAESFAKSPAVMRSDCFSPQTRMPHMLLYLAERAGAAATGRSLTQLKRPIFRVLHVRAQPSLPAGHTWRGLNGRRACPFEVTHA